MIFRPGMMWLQVSSDYSRWDALENFESESWRPNMSKWSLGAQLHMAHNIFSFTNDRC